MPPGKTEDTHTTHTHTETNTWIYGVCILKLIRIVCFALLYICQWPASYSCWCSRSWCCVLCSNRRRRHHVFFFPVACIHKPFSQFKRCNFKFVCWRLFGVVDALVLDVRAPPIQIAIRVSMAHAKYWHYLCIKYWMFPAVVSVARVQKRNGEFVRRISDCNWLHWILYFSISIFLLCLLSDKRCATNDHVLCAIFDFIGFWRFFSVPQFCDEELEETQSSSLSVPFSVPQKTNLNIIIKQTENPTYSNASTLTWKFPAAFWSQPADSTEH